MQAGTVSKHFISSGVQLVTDVLISLLSSSWEMGDSFSPEGTQDEGSSSSSEDTQWSPLHWSRSSMQLEIKRLQTFRFWPVSVPISPADLAAAGFYFVGPADTVQCFCCGGLLYNWVADEDPMVEHKKFFPSCLYVQDKMVGNCRQMPWSEEHRDCVDGQFLGMLQSLNVEESPAGGQPEYPYMETEGDRLVSFENWPSYSPVSPQLLARAGFFYTGQQDYVRCFYCDGALRNWEQGDDPWIEHARWFPRCAFLLQSRGRDFINQTQESNVMLEDNLHWSEYSESSHESMEREPDPWRVKRETQVECSHKPESTTSMEEKLRRLQEERMCKVCMDKDVSIVLVPCGHLVVCAECAPNLRRCPICRGVIRDSMKAFLS
ncbi:baculoviral IAP repeat-containing protein 7 [Pseudonaja textilis]|uniref:RING-type E3 ubiquitin transferase n=1 Tax=Pseudonaja textilis TaxID=8673 RepID=A0A670ZB48_PSETE|nr:baculoviral IAP repeat-containing protein 7 [Pseudonaja textilis]XP_026553154.1 baculoviral IAP repeat-containing protein 7 [Pseudonaja textilis]XP_026553155.1 baculoviral IAP repeat-containing protein 7 [Pseudonaja textilis]